MLRPTLADVFTTQTVGILWMRRDSWVMNCSVLWSCLDLDHAESPLSLEIFEIYKAAGMHLKPHNTTLPSVLAAS